MIKIIDRCILCKWANLQNQQGVKYLFPPLYVMGGWRKWQFFDRWKWKLYFWLVPIYFYL